MADRRPDELVFIQQRIRNLRKLNNKITAKEVSLSLGWDETALSKIENGTNFPLFGTLLSICGYFNISLGEFFAPLLDNENSRIAEAYSLVNQLPENKLEIVISVMQAMLDSKNM